MIWDPHTAVFTTHLKAMAVFLRHGAHRTKVRGPLLPLCALRPLVGLKRLIKGSVLTVTMAFFLPLVGGQIASLMGAGGSVMGSMREARAATTVTIATTTQTGGVSTPGHRIVVGGKNFTEQLILSEITAQYLKGLGYRTELKNGLGSTVMRSAQVNGELDVVWEYTGTSLVLYNHVTQKLDEAQAYERVKALDAKRGLVWLNQSDINNTYAIAVPRDKVGNLRTLSDFAAYVRKNQLDGQDHRGTGNQLAMDAEFGGRSDGLRPMLAAYGITLPRRDIKQMDPGLVYTALKNGQVSAGVVYTTDGRVAGFNLALLADDKHYFPGYRATPVVRQETLANNPLLAGQLNTLAAVLNTATMTTLNKRVDIDQASLGGVAHDFLFAHHLLPSASLSTSATVSADVSAKHATGFIAFLRSDWPELLKLTLQHIELVALAVGAAILIGVPLGLMMSRLAWLATALLALGTVLLTLPSIALFGLMIPIFSKIGQGIGTLPAVVAVFLYSLLPIMRNTYLALTNVDPGIREAGTGIGMTLGQRLRYVELPLAVPGIMSGVRMAVVMNIGVMTIAAVIGAGGLGVLILQAISQSNMTKVAVGAVLVSVLAIAVDLLLVRLQRALTPKGIQRI